MLIAGGKLDRAALADDVVIVYWHGRFRRPRAGHVSSEGVATPIAVAAAVPIRAKLNVAAAGCARIATSLG
jgi:hypothetical protein